MRNQHRRIFDAARFIVFGNPGNARDFTNYYGNYEQKSVITGFGDQKFVRIRELLTSGDRKAVRAGFKIPDDKVVVACGYNGRAMQQHLLLLDQLGQVAKPLREKLFLVLQLGYGADKQYQQSIIAKLEEIGVDFKIIDTMLSDEEIASLRVVPDITLNAQISDGFSSSIQEHLLARNILIVGDWLPYSFLQERGVYFFRKPIEGFAGALEEVMADLDAHWQKTKPNTELLWAISSWEVRIAEWLSVYRGEVDQIAFKMNDNGNHH